MTPALSRIIPHDDLSQWLLARFKLGLLLYCPAPERLLVHARMSPHRTVPFAFGPDAFTASAELDVADRAEDRAVAAKAEPALVAQIGDPTGEARASQSFLWLLEELSANPKVDQVVIKHQTDPSIGTRVTISAQA